MKYNERPKDAMGRVMDSPSGLEFMPPEELDLKGRKGTAEVSWMRKPDGTVCITSFNGVSIGGEQEEMGEESEDSQGEGGDVETGEL